MTEIFLASLLIGGLAGISAGMFGIGGGVLVVPFLSWLFELKHFDPKHIMLLAVATSLATALPSSASSLRTHQKLGNVVWHRAFRLMPSLLLAAASGAALAEHLSANLLRWFFVAYLFYASLQMLLPTKALAEIPKPKLYLDYPMGLLIGTVSAIIGIGGGAMTVPYLIGSGLPIKNAVATSSACALPIAFSAAASYIYWGWHAQGLPEGGFGYIYLPAFLGITATSIFTAPIGARLAHRLPAKQLKRYFAWVLILMAIKMIW